MSTVLTRSQTKRQRDESADSKETKVSSTDKKIKSSLQLPDYRNFTALEVREFLLRTEGEAVATCFSRVTGRSLFWWNPPLLQEILESVPDAAKVSKHIWNALHPGVKPPDEQLMQLCDKFQFRFGSNMTYNELQRIMFALPIELAFACGQHPTVAEQLRVLCCDAAAKLFRPLPSPLAPSGK